MRWSAELPDTETTDRHMRNFFIAGTDTGVGKTALTAALLAEARRRGLDVALMKPIQTGCLRHGGRLVAPDVEFSLAVAQWTPPADELELLCPCKLEPACSPHLAALRSGHPIDVKSLLKAFSILRARHAAVLVEGAGGALVPIREDYLMSDLMRDMRLPVILAARAGLGTINHTLLTLRELRRAQVEIFGVVLIAREPGLDSDLADDNARMIEKLGDAPVLARMPFFQSLENVPGNFPIIGKMPPDFSNHWKIQDLFFR